MLLLDSGGQYSDGTTDATRTVHLGTPTAFQKECFTRVLQGHINLDSCVFPEGTPGCALDCLARQVGRPILSLSLFFMFVFRRRASYALSFFFAPLKLKVATRGGTPSSSKRVPV